MDNTLTIAADSYVLPMSAFRSAWMAAFVLVCAACTPGPASSPTTPGAPTSSGDAAPPNTSTPTPPTPTTSSPPVTTFTESQAAALAVAALQPFDNRPSASRFTGQLTPCADHTFGYDPATTRVMVSQDETFLSYGVDGHPLQNSASAAAPFADEATAEAKTGPAFASISSCVSDAKQSDGSTSHVVGSPLATSPPFAGGVKVVTTGVYDSKKPDYTVTLLARVHNVLVVCEADGLEQAAAEQSTQLCLDAAGRAALVPTTLPPTGRDTVVDATTVRTALGRTTVDGYTLVRKPPGYAQVCVLAAPAATRRDGPPALSLGFAVPAEVDDAFPNITVLAVPYSGVAEATARIVDDAGQAQSCVGQLQNPDPKFVPTFATAHGSLTIGDHGVFTTHEERYPTGTTYYASEATRLGSVVVYVQARGKAADEARARADLGLAAVAKQLNAG